MTETKNDVLPIGAWHAHPDHTNTTLGLGQVEHNDDWTHER